MLRYVYYVGHLHTKFHKNNYSSLIVIANDVQVYSNPKTELSCP
jgi:hypothetical protein